MSEALIGVDPEILAAYFDRNLARRAGEPRP